VARIAQVLRTDETNLGMVRARFFNSQGAVTIRYEATDQLPGYQFGKRIGTALTAWKRNWDIAPPLFWALFPSKSFYIVQNLVLDSFFNFGTEAIAKVQVKCDDQISACLVYLNVEFCPVMGTPASITFAAKKLL
jgi:hypothetical protein